MLDWILFDSNFQDILLLEVAAEFRGEIYTTPYTTLYATPYSIAYFLIFRIS